LCDRCLNEKQISLLILTKKDPSAIVNPTIQFWKKGNSQ